MTPQEAAVTLDPITLEVIRSRLEVIAAEMQATLLKSAFSMIIKEAADASSALFDAQGRMLAQAAALPAHLGMLVPAVETIVRTFPPATMQPGDLYILNDPYNGGTHLPDICLMAPVFVSVPGPDGVEQRLVALSGSLAHHQDVGGKAPGSTPPDAVDLYAEGLILPPLKLHDRGRRDETLYALIARNVRIPRIVLGDIDAQIACARVGERRLAELFAEYGFETVTAAFDQLLDYAERLTRLGIETIPDGNYHFEDFVDDDGIDIGRPVPIRARVDVRGSDLHVDFTGSSPQVRGAINSVPSSTMAIIYYTVRTVTNAIHQHHPGAGSDQPAPPGLPGSGRRSSADAASADSAIPDNAGCYRPVTAYLPAGSIVNPRPPAPVSVRTVTIKRVVDVLMGALAQAIPDRVHAASNGQLASFKLGGLDPRTGKVYVTNAGVPTAGGMGARPGKDGIDVIDTDLSNMTCPPVEATEQDYPLRVHHIRLWTDSGGAGRWRGGLGYEAAWELLRGEATFTHRRDRHRFRPWGLFGGGPAPVCATRLVRDGTEREVPGKQVFPIRAGDLVRVWTTGGGGYGNPLARPPETVLSDVLDGRVSPEAAARDYGVVLTPAPAGSVDRFAIDQAATAARRAELAARRGASEQAVDRGEPIPAAGGDGDGDGDGS